MSTRERSRLSTFCALFVACLLLAGIAHASPSITLSRKSGPPTSKILVSGRGFAPNVGVDIYFDTKDEALVVINSKGEFHNAKAYAPRSAYPGQHWVTALERNNDKGAQEPFLVQTNWRQFHRQDMMRLNPYENVLNPKTVGRLDLNWSYATLNGVPSSPVIAKGVVYVSSGFSDYKVYALNASTGAKLWSSSYPTGGTPPAVENGVVYVGGGDYNIYALKASTGVTLWSYTTGNDVAAPPTVENGVVYVGSLDDNVYALDASTGALLWIYSIGGGTGGYVTASAAVANGTVYVPSVGGVLYALNARTGVLLWSYVIGSGRGNSDSSPAVANGVVYVGSNDDNVYALNASTGALLWSYTTGGQVSSSPALANGVVYIGSDDYKLYALDASTGAELWSYSTGSWVTSSPAVANGVVYVGSLDGNLYALNASTGAFLWSYATAYEEDSSPVVANGVVYVGSGYQDDNVYGFRLGRNYEGQYKGVSERPDMKTLRPDFSRKVSKPVATASRH